MADRTTRQLQPQAADRLDAYRRRRRRPAATTPWERYAAAAGAAVAGASTAEAAIVHVVPENPIRISVSGSSTDSASVDLDGDGSNDFAFELFRSTSTTSTTFSGSFTTTYQREATAFAAGLNGARVFRNVDNNLRNFASGELISASLSNDRTFGLMRQGTQSQIYVSTTSGSTYSLSFSGSSGDFPAGGTGIVGGLFNSPRGLQTAWIRVALTDADDAAIPGELEVLEWAYEDTGAPIAAGVVPEPTGLAMLAAGAAGIAGLRRRSRSAPR